MRIALSIIIIALLSACSGERGKIVLKGELSGLRQGALLAWNNDGQGSGKIDTIKIERGQFEYTAPAGEGVSSWTLLYPNMSTLTLFGSSGDVLRLSGQANELRRVTVTGTPDNELYTSLRQGTLTADSLIVAHPATAVARHVLRTMYLDDDKADRKTRARLYRIMREANPDDTLLASWSHLAQAKTTLAIGKRLPRFTLHTAGGDTICDTTFRHHPLLIGVWCSADVSGRSLMKCFRDARRMMNGTPQGKKTKSAKPKLELLTINVDLEPKTRTMFERLDSVDWYRVNTDNLFDHPLLRRWNIDSAPYTIYVDTAGIVRAMGADFEKDIKPKL